MQTLGFKGFVRYIFALLFGKSERESTFETRKMFLFRFKSYFHSKDIQLLEFWNLKFYDVIIWLSMEQEIFITEWLRE